MKKLGQIIFFILCTSICSGQSDLRIECYPTYEFANGFYLNDTLIEYGCCGNTPSIYLGIADDTCTFWNNQTDLGNHNAPWDSWICRQRVEQYFVYRQNDYNQLQALDSVINQVIPDNHAFFMYTPVSYDHNSIQSICPDLAQTFVNQWGSSIDTADMIILFGIKGFPQSYDLMVGSSGDTLIYNHTVCPDCNFQYPIANYSASETFVDLQNSGEVIFTNNSLNSDSVIINFGDGNSSSFVDSISYVYTNTGVFESELIAFNGTCSDTISITITVVNSVGIESNNILQYGLQVFPNPSSESFNIRFKKGVAGTCRIYDSRGRVTRVLELTGESNYKIFGLKSGTYLIVVTYSTDETELKKILIN